MVAVDVCAIELRQSFEIESHYTLQAENKDLWPTGLDQLIFAGGDHVETVRLSDLKPGDTGVVADVTAGGRITARLMELGLVPGAAVVVLRKAPFGDPVQYRVRGSVISMRAAEAACVAVWCQSSDRGVVDGELLLAGSLR